MLALRRPPASRISSAERSPRCWRCWSSVPSCRWSSRSIGGVADASTAATRSRWVRTTATNWCCIRSAVPTGAGSATAGRATTSPGMNRRAPTANTSRWYRRWTPSARTPSSVAVERCGRTTARTASTAPRWRSCSCRTGPMDASAAARVCSSRRPVPLRITSSPPQRCRPAARTPCASCAISTMTQRSACRTCKSSASAITWHGPRKPSPRPRCRQASRSSSPADRGTSTRLPTATSWCRLLCSPSWCNNGPATSASAGSSWAPVGSRTRRSGRRSQPPMVRRPGSTSRPRSIRARSRRTESMY
ncbi:unannotated protein [freshwater metagenome]|uniref:Unannotated protein n=1 Tax=freshwater metagenome TaxID=449393 RepID=A0A6J7EPY8_9ZZZZ